MKIQLKDYSSAEEAESALKLLFPVGTPVGFVRSNLDDAGLKYRFFEDKHISCRFLEPSTTMVHVVWNLVFYFDAESRLDRILVNRGLVGP